MKTLNVADKRLHWSCYDLYVVIESFTKFLEKFSETPSTILFNFLFILQFH